MNLHLTKVGIKLKILNFLIKWFYLLLNILFKISMNKKRSLLVDSKIGIVIKYMKTSHFVNFSGEKKLNFL